MSWPSVQRLAGVGRARRVALFTSVFLATEQVAAYTSGQPECSVNWFVASGVTFSLWGALGVCRPSDFRIVRGALQHAQRVMQCRETALDRRLGRTCHWGTGRPCLRGVEVA